jgi:predicted lipoprotein
MKRILLIILPIILISCGKDKEEDKPSFNKSALIKKQAELLDTYFSELEMSSEKLVQSLKDFGTNTNQTQLDEIRNNWKSTILDWQAVQFFYVKDLKYSITEPQIAFWPADTLDINTNLGVGAASMNLNWVQGLGANNKGLFTLEYLLFSDSKDPLSNEAIRKYALFTAENIELNIKKLKNVWENTYKSDFITSTENYVTSTIPILANRLVEIGEKNKNQRLGYPMAVVKYTMVDINKLECIYADFSMEIIAKNISIMENVYLGDKGTGYDDYLKTFGDNGKAIDEDIKKQFTKLKESAENLPKPMVNNWTNPEPTYKGFYDDWKLLIQYLKSEMLSTLSITPTFSDADGD